MSKEMWSQLDKFQDGDNLNAEVLNKPIGQLGARTEYLYSRLAKLTSGDTLSSVIFTNAKLSGNPEKGCVVYYDKDSDTFAPAKADMDLYDDFKAADSAFSIGILMSKDGDSGDVLMYGRMNLNPAGYAIVAANMIESGETFRSGRYYLSANEAGKLTEDPTGPRIYMCSIFGSVGKVSGTFEEGSFAIVNPQFLDIGTSHVHRTATLVARPAGALSADRKHVIGYKPDKEPNSPISLIFGGTWTADPNTDIQYSFTIGAGPLNWVSGVNIQYTENDGQINTVTVHYPDEEVSVSNGLTLKLHVNGAVYGLAESASWSGLSFPGAGQGWVDHEPTVEAALDGSVLRVVLRGGLGVSSSVVNVVFPGEVQLFDVTTATNKTFTYNEHTYQLVEDGESATSGNIEVPLGTNDEDSAAYLARALERNEGTSFAAFYDNTSPTPTAKLLIIDGEATDANGMASNKTSVVRASFDVVSRDGEFADEVVAVVYNAENRVLSDVSVVLGIKAYEWKTAGNISLLLRQDGTDPVTVAPGTKVSAELVDYEPKALYDYVIGMDQLISNYWPPVPVKSAALMVNGVEMDNKDLFPDNPTVSFGRDTIHWFEDDEGRKPWPEAATGRYSVVNPHEDKTEAMHWVRGFQGSTGPVTSLQARAGSPIKVLAYGTDKVANTGDLEISADFDFEVVAGGLAGYNVPKRARNGKLIAGPMVERIIGGAGVNVTQAAGCPVGQGTVTISLDDDTYRSQFNDIALENAEQAKVGMFPYIRLRGYPGSAITTPSAFTATMRVPTSLNNGQYALRMQATVFGESGFTDGSANKPHLACVKLNYGILPDYHVDDPSRQYLNLKTGLFQPNQERTVYIPLGHSVDGTAVVYNEFDPVVLTMEGEGDEADVVIPALGDNIPSEIDFSGQDRYTNLRPGYLVGIRISRAVVTTPPAEYDGCPAYTGSLGFINLSWSLVSVR